MISLTWSGLTSRVSHGSLRACWLEFRRCKCVVAKIRPAPLDPSRHRRRLSTAASFPIVDIDPFVERNRFSADARSHAAESLAAACEQTGFFYLVGHGVPVADMSAVHEMARAFFAQPDSIKEEISIASCVEGGRGYQRIGENITSGLRDWHEGIDFLAEPDEQSVDFALVDSLVRVEKHDGMRRLVHARNRWPRKPDGFRSTMEAHFSRMDVLGRALMEATALTFGLPAGHFGPSVDKSFWVARVLGYPPLSAASEGISCGEHTDYGWWTLLSQDDTPGALEARTAGGEWTTVEPMTGAFVVNLGDMLHIWSGRRFAATPHRVRQTQQDRFRTSVTYFYEPNFDAVIRPLDESRSGIDYVSEPTPASSQVTPSRAMERALHGEAIIYGEHLYDKCSSNFKID
eukprot:TRINITY_DN69058_c0_g1_i1.p1 TRINITY_DN69058_c0_g1~~TRINITY_DN69058_c0_g1_i1.p1  ORF type:complete len:403 (-),score=33.25 TRINITY_DN69058_c0_g1_i1:33-1241(-)